MRPEDEGAGSFEDLLRSIAQEVGRSVERAADRLDVEEVAHNLGVDPQQAREWVDVASSWLRARVQSLGNDIADQASGPAAAPDREDPFEAATPDPLDLPSDDQGVALAALESGRWAVEPGSGSLTSREPGRGPNDALGLFLELRSRDWITAEGALTLAGRHALGRWLEVATSKRG
jgi:hypothetical protein